MLHSPYNNNNNNNAFIYIAQHYMYVSMGFDNYYSGFMDLFIPIPFQSLRCIYSSIAASGALNLFIHMHSLSNQIPYRYAELYTNGIAT